MDPREAGFGIRVTPSGTKLFVARARIGGLRKRITLGEFPALKTADARSLARLTLADIRAGRSPLVEREARIMSARAGDMTVTDLAAKWLADHVRPKLKPRTAADYEDLLAKRILPAVGHLSVTRLSRDHVIALHVAMAKTPRRANYAVAVLRALLTFASDLKLRPPLDNPCRKIRLYRERPRERFLTETEFGKAAEAISEAENGGGIGRYAAAGLRMCLFTGARSGEIMAAQWRHIDWQRNLIRLPDSKTNEPRTIHLSAAALDVITSLVRVEPYIIAGSRPGEPFKNLSRAWIVTRAKRGLHDVRLHDLRHSFASLAAGRGVSLQMIGRLLGHRRPQTTARYSHLSRDAVAEVNAEIGAAMVAAIEKSAAPMAATVVKLKRRNRR
jgi:integrase